MILTRIFVCHCHFYDTAHCVDSIQNGDSISCQTCRTYKTYIRIGWRLLKHACSNKVDIISSLCDLCAFGLLKYPAIISILTFILAYDIWNHLLNEILNYLTTYYYEEKQYQWTSQSSPLLTSVHMNLTNKQILFFMINLFPKYFTSIFGFGRTKILSPISKSFQRDKNFLSTPS